MSNLFQRILVGAIAIPVLLYVTYKGGHLFFIFTAAAAIIALYEFYSLFEQRKFNLLKFPVLIISLSAFAAFYFQLTDPLIIFLTYVLLIFSIEVFKYKHDPLNSFICICGFIYVMIPFLLLNELSEFRTNPDGVNLAVVVFILIWICDTAAYFGGKTYGKKPLTIISPKKTMEGAVTGFIAAVIFSMSLNYFFPELMSLKDFIAMGIIIGIVSQIGDIFESMIKRYCGVKDSSSIIPGHGGVLDRFDSLIFVAPAVYVYIKMIQMMI